VLSVGASSRSTGIQSDCGIHRGIMASSGCKSSPLWTLLKGVGLSEVDLDPACCDAYVGVAQSWTRHHRQSCDRSPAYLNFTLPHHNIRRPRTSVLIPQQPTCHGDQTCARQHETRQTQISAGDGTSATTLRRAPMRSLWPRPLVECSSEPLSNLAGKSEAILRLEDDECVM
jgi:hypothetical protein